MDNSDNKGNSGVSNGGVSNSIFYFAGKGGMVSPFIILYKNVSAYRGKLGLAKLMVFQWNLRTLLYHGGPVRVVIRRRRRLWCIGNTLLCCFCTDRSKM